MATQIVKRQIADGAIDDNKVQAGANIATSKLALNGTIILKDGSVAFTGNQSLGSFKLTNLGTPTPASNDAARIIDVENAIASVTGLFISKGTVRIATTTNGTLSTAFANGQTIDGVVLATGNRILLKNQSAPAENGIYTVNASGAPTRALDMDVWSEVPGSWVTVQEGTANSDTVWLSTANQGGTLGSTSITWINPIVSGSYSNSNFVDKEVPSGLINGSNVTYILANTPTVGSEHVYLNGVFIESGDDYAISGATITMTTAPFTGEKFRVSYRK